MSLDRDALFESATRANAMGRLEEAASMCGQMLANDPTDVQAKTLSGTIAARKGKFPEAIALLDEVLRTNPESIEALIWLSVSFRKSGSLKPATGAAIRATQLKPEDAHVLNNLGLCQMAMMDLPAATTSFRAAAGRMPDSSEIAHNLGTVLYMQGLQDEASVAFKKAVAVAPKSASGYVGLGRTLLTQEQFAEALDCAERALQIDPNLVSAHLLIAQLLVHEGRSREAQKHCEKAIALEPENSVAYGALGSALESQGFIDEAEAYFRKSIALQPKQAQAYFSLSYGRKIKESDQEMMQAMHGLIAEARLAQSDIKSLHYALGRAYETFKQYEKAMHHYDEANRIARYIKFRDEPFDRGRHEAPVEWLQKTFTRQFMDQFHDIGSESDKPIFIVGMIRSGTTLMEQILSSHPKVDAGGELPFWTEKGPTAFDPATQTMIPGRLVELEENYLSLLNDIAPQAPRVTDKMPGNTIPLGVIHIAFPNARIIYMKRNAADTCFSIYATPNEARLPFAHSKENIAFAYRTHQRLMQHWREVLPSDRFMQVNYEELVEDRERVTREVLEFCGLEWSDQCLSPEENKRTVVTPSVWQVRQPVYRTSMLRWKNFEPWLAEFESLL